MGVSKIVIGNTTRIDITDTTATVNSVLDGFDFYDENGDKQSGAVEFITIYTGSTTPPASLGADGDIYIKI